MNPLLLFGLVLIAGSSNACGPGGFPPLEAILDYLKDLKEHAGHDHAHGHHHDGIKEVVMEHLGGRYVFAEKDQYCPKGSDTIETIEDCMEAMMLYKSNRRMKNIKESDPTHPPGCHVIHATGEWHFNPWNVAFNPETFDPDLVVRGVHLICKVNSRGVIKE